MKRFRRTIKSTSMESLHNEKRRDTRCLSLLSDHINPGVKEFQAPGPAFYSRHSSLTTFSSKEWRWLVTIRMLSRLGIVKLGLLVLEKTSKQRSRRQHPLSKPQHLPYNSSFSSKSHLHRNYIKMVFKFIQVLVKCSVEKWTKNTQTSRRTGNLPFTSTNTKADSACATCLIPVVWTSDVLMFNEMMHWSRGKTIRKHTGGKFQSSFTWNDEFSLRHSTATIPDIKCMCFKSSSHGNPSGNAYWV